MMTPTDLSFSESHEWVRVAADNTVTIGISDFAQHELGDVVYLELPNVGATLTRDDPFGTVESVKAVSDLVAPVSGQVTAVNAGLVESPEAINADPYAAWLVTVRLSDPAELDVLMTADQYNEFTEQS